MQITKCNECGYEIGTKTSLCPGCGDKLGIEIGGVKGFIRRIFIVILVVYIFLTAIGII